MAKYIHVVAWCMSALVLTTAIRSAAGEAVLADSSMLAAFDTDTGALIRLENISTHWVVERRPELGVSFRLFAPLPERRYNPVFGQKQHGAKVKKISDHEVKFRWKNLVSENGGVLSMTLNAEVTLNNGALVFGATLQNNSALPVETIDYPCFGDLNPPGRDSLMEARTPANHSFDNMQSNEIYPHFRNEKGYWGVSYPTKTLEAQPSPFCLIQAPGQGLYCEATHATTSYRLQYTFEQHPGVISSVNNLVPQTDEFSGFPVHLEFRFCHFIFAKPHSTTKLVPVVLHGYSGDWHQGVEVFKESHHTPPP